MVLGKIEDILIDIGSMLKRERLYRNLSQKVVAERSGISESAVFVCIKPAKSYV